VDGQTSVQTEGGYLHIICPEEMVRKVYVSALSTTQHEAIAVVINERGTGIKEGAKSDVSAWTLTIVTASLYPGPFVTDVAEQVSSTVALHSLDHGRFMTVAHRVCKVLVLIAHCTVTSEHNVFASRNADMPLS
jgi:hypothetical protein